MKYTFALILLSFQFCASAQDTTKRWQVSVGLAFSTIPSATVSGTDTVYKTALSVSPDITLRNTRNGLGISYSPSLILGSSQPGIYLHTLTAGIEQYDKKRFDIVADYIHYFFTGNESSPVSPLSNEIYTYLCYKKPWLQPSFSIDFAFNPNSGKKSSFLYDAAISAGVGHSFDWESSNIDFNIKPFLKLNAATNNYYSFMHGTQYITHGNSFRKYLKKNQGFNLSVNNIELNMESSIEKGPFSVRPSFSVFLPVTSGISGVEGYWQIAFEYKF